MMRRIAALALIVTVAVSWGCASSKNEGELVQTSSEITPSDPLYPLTLMREGSMLLQQGRYDDALKQFEKARKLQPTNATVYNMIGLCYLRKGQFHEALKAFDHALELIPSFSDALNNRGLTYLAMKQYRMAEVDFLAVLADVTYPHRKEVYYNLGMTQLGRGDLRAAEENFRKAIVPPRAVFEAYLRLAEIFQKQGRLDDAIRMLEDARLEFPDRVEARLELGKLQLATGRTEEARENLQAVIDAAPSSEMAAQAKDLLAQAGGN